MAHHALRAALLPVLFALACSPKNQATTPPEPAPEEDGVVCTMDAMTCPDGTEVGRTGPDCEFVCPEGEDPTTDDELEE
jgi:hypothetical protein